MLDPIIQFRRTLHQYPELSGHEKETARKIVRFFESLQPDMILEGLGGNGVAIVFSGEKPGPTVLLRCELDALPIQETNQTDYRSLIDGISHKCGHDGHMAILAAVGVELAAKRPDRGRVVILYQAAEENGEGAAAILRDPRFAEIKPHFAFALHNLPGFPLGQIIIRSGAISCASRGVIVKLSGKTAHAAYPETGLSPVSAMCHIIHQFTNLPSGTVPPKETAFATVVGAKLGEKAFGTAAGKAEIWATLRSETDETMAKLVNDTEEIVSNAATQYGLKSNVKYEDVYIASINSDLAVDIVQRAVGKNSMHIMDKPFRWSEDFGRFTAISEGAFLGIGAGTDIPDLHHPDYDFPDVLIPQAKAVLLRIVEECLVRKESG